MHPRCDRHVVERVRRIAGDTHVFHVVHLGLLCLHRPVRIDRRSVLQQQHRQDVQQRRDVLVGRVRLVRSRR